MEVSKFCLKNSLIYRLVMTSLTLHKVKTQNYYSPDLEKCNTIPSAKNHHKEYRTYILARKLVNYKPHARTTTIYIVLDSLFE